MTEHANVTTQLSAAEAAVLESELAVYYLLAGAKSQVLAIARHLYDGSTESITDEYMATEAPDLARTLRLAKTLGADISILVTRPETD